MKKNIFFYSQNCIYSKKAIEFMLKSDIASDFIKVDINNSGSFALPSTLTMVPALAIVGEKKLRQGKEVMDYLESFVKSSQNELLPQSTGSSSGMFAYLDENENQKITSSTNYTPLQERPQMALRPEEFNESAESVDSRLERMKMARDQGITIPRPEGDRINFEMSSNTPVRY